MVQVGLTRTFPANEPRENSPLVPVETLLVLLRARVHITQPRRDIRVFAIVEMQLREIEELDSMTFANPKDSQTCDD